MTSDHTPSRACYLRGCRQTGCVDANKRYCKQYRATRYTSGRRRVDAAPYAAIARRYADAGWSHKETGSIVGCSETVIHDLLNGCARVSPITARRLDAIPATPERPGSAAREDATGTRRRGQALHAIGYTVDEMAAELGLHPDHVSRILRGIRFPRVTAATRTKMAALYANWSSKPGTSVASRRRAVHLGWRDPHWWEDYGHIDDPDFDPASVIEEAGFRERAALRREEIIHFAWHGDTPEQILARLGGEVSISTVRQTVAEWRTGTKRQRKQAAA